MKRLLLSSIVISLALSSCAQPGNDKAAGNAIDRKVGGKCEGCEAIYESPVPADRLKATDTLPDFNEEGPRLEVSGILYQRDGKTPAAGIVMYFYHTDQKGVYPTRGNETNWGKRHGYLRGWIRTGADGRYSFYTLRPASYPNSRSPAHIHATIKEPGMTAYWIDDFLFADDPYLKGEKRNRAPRGGDGVLTTTLSDGMLHAKRDIILGLNIEDYPVK